MKKEPTYKSIRALAIPALFGGIVEPVLSLTDIAVVGNIGSNELSGTGDNLSAVAAVGIAGSLLSALIWIFAQMKSAISAVVSQAYGAKRMLSVSTLIPQMLWFNLVVSLIALFTTYVFCDWIFEYLLSAKGAVLADATTYYKIRVVGFPLTLLTFSIFGIFRGIQNTIWAMTISIIGGGLNILLDFMLVLGTFDIFIPMGVEGAALASVIAQAVMFLLALYFLFFKSKIKLLNAKNFNPNFKNLLLIAGNLVLRTFVLNIALILTHKFANIYGEKFAATHAVILNLWLFSAFFLDAFATAANAISGKLLGARDFEGMQRNLNRNLGLALIVSFLLAIITLTLHPYFMPFLIDNPKVWEVYPPIIVLFAVCLPINAVAFILDGIFKGMGRAKLLRNVLFVSTLVGFLPVLLIGHYLTPGLEIVWWALIAWMGIRALLPYVLFKNWIKKEV